MDTTEISRRSFLRTAVSASLLSASGALFSRPYAMQHADNVAIRFAVCSDGHWGQSGTNYTLFYNDLIKWLNSEYDNKGLDFLLYAGDLTTDKASQVPDVKAALDKLKMPLYATRGNHDCVTVDTWKKIFGYEPEYAFKHENCAFILADTYASSCGAMGCANSQWLDTQLKYYPNHCDHIFVAMHVPQNKWDSKGKDCSTTRSALEKCPNLRAVFFGHNHNADSLRTLNGVQYFNDGHAGGGYGTPYRGYRIVEIRTSGEIATYQFNGQASKIVNSNTIHGAVHARAPMSYDLSRAGTAKAQSKVMRQFNLRGQMMHQTARSKQRLHMQLTK